VEYEDELDLLALLVTGGDGEEEAEGRAHVKLHDNKSGELLKTVPLAQAWDVVRRPGGFYGQREDLMSVIEGVFLCSKLVGTSKYAISGDVMGGDRFEVRVDHWVILSFVGFWGMGFLGYVTFFGQ